MSRTASSFAASSENVTSDALLRATSLLSTVNLVAFKPPETGRRIPSSCPPVELSPDEAGRDLEPGRDILAVGVDWRDTPNIEFAIKSLYVPIPKLQAASSPLANKLGVAEAFRANSDLE